MLVMEEFKDIEGYEGIYQISNLGNVKSLKFGKEKILKPVKNIKGYLYVNLRKNGKMKSMRVHRIVAQEFIENPLNLPEVNHIDENKENNKIDNLEWCDRKYNVNYGTMIERMSKTLTNRNDQSIKIDQFTKDGRFIKTWCSSREAERNGYRHGDIIKCCKGRRYSANGYIWRYHK